MAVLPILPANDPILRQRSKRVRNIDSSIERLIDDMFDTMHETGGVGLAAPQVGVLLRVIIIELPGDDPIALINPEIIKRSGEQEVREGCLCLPGYRGKVKRPLKVTAKGKDRNGKDTRIKAAGLLAEALDHEIDHLNGILYIDHLESMEKLERIEGEEGLI